MDHFTQFSEQIQQWAASLGFPLEAALRLFLAGVAGGLVGLEREVRGRQAGFRTNLLVCLGSALVMVVSARIAFIPWPAGAGVHIQVDPARIAYGVMTGIGFLGAGTIIQHRGGVRGLTTAAGLWCMAAVGLAVGSGLYVLSFMAVVMILLSLWLLDKLEDILPKVRYRTITIRRKWQPDCVADTIGRFKTAKLDVLDASFRRSNDLAYADISLDIAFINARQYYTFERQLGADPEYQLISSSRE